MTIREFASQKWNQLKETMADVHVTYMGIAVLLMAIVIFGLAVNQTRMPSEYPPRAWIEDEYEAHRKHVATEIRLLKSEQVLLLKQHAEILVELKAIKDAIMASE